MFLANKLNSFFKTFDMFFFQLFGHIQNHFLTSIEKFITFFGSTRFVIILLIVSVIMLLFKNTRKIGLCIIVSLVISTCITNFVLKPLIKRPRPYIFYQDNSLFQTWYKNAGSIIESNYSFPSGHTTAAFSYCTSLYLCFKKNHKSSCLFLLLAILVMFSRIYLMVHFASDVLFGMFVGIISSFIAYKVSNRVCL